MNLLNLIKKLLNIQKEIDVRILPSQGLFYKDDFHISIKKADIQDIIEYEFNYIKDDISVVITKLKNIVESNTIISNGYKFNNIKSIDIIFIFLEIVKFTKGKSIELRYFNDEKGKEDVIKFDSDHFNYFSIDKKTMSRYDSVEKVFDVDGYKFSLPSIGLENCLTNFLIDKSYSTNATRFNEYNYDFTYFMGNKDRMTFEEIDNLIQIFNFDMDDTELKKVRKIVESFSPIQKYSLKKGNRIIDINTKINLEKIWK